MTNLGAWCVAVLLVLVAPAWAGAMLRRVVVRDREHGAPIAGVELTAPGANLLSNKQLQQEIDQAQTQLQQAVAGWLLKGRFAKARPGNKKMLSLARQTSDTALVAQALNNLGVLNRNENHNAEARKDFEEALAIRRALAVQNPGVYRPCVASTLNNLDNLRSDENRNAEARKNYEEALAIYREFAARVRATYQQRVQQIEQDFRDLDPVSP